MNKKDNDMQGCVWSWVAGLLPIRVERVSELELAALRADPVLGAWLA